MSSPWIPLANALKGQKLVIRAIESADVRTQIIRFGLAIGEGVICQEKLPKGPVVIRKNRQEIAIGRSLALSIQVEVVAS